jgi:hypothetical protein
MLRRAIMDVVPDDDQGGAPPSGTADDQFGAHDGQADGAEASDAEDEDSSAHDAEAEDVTTGDSSDRAK